MITIQDEENWYSIEKLFQFYGRSYKNYAWYSRSNSVFDIKNKYVVSSDLNNSRLSIEVMLHGSLLYILGAATEKLLFPYLVLENGTNNRNLCP